MRLSELSSAAARTLSPRGLWLIDPATFAFSAWCAFVLRFEMQVPQYEVRNILYAVSIWVVVKLIVFRLFGLHRRFWRYVSVPDVVSLCLGNFTASLIACPIIVLLAPPGFPRSVFVLDLLICTCATGGVRLLARIWLNSEWSRRSRGKRVLIYGAGHAGVRLLREIRSSRELGYMVCGFIDDKAAKSGLLIQGTKVLGTGSALSVLVTKHRIEEVLIAMATVDGPTMTAILRRCHQAGVSCRTIPGLAQIIEGQALTPQIRDVAVEDLLGRSAVKLDESAIREELQGQRILITGVAGSIGSELCRQIASFEPQAIVGFEIAETPLFELEREMQQKYPEIPFYPEIGSIQNRQRLAEVIERFSIQIVFHAAAYKHVPLMETHFFEAVENNILGTENLASVAAECGVSRFVMISSDKAVRPTNVMGATKRVAELLVNSMRNDTKYVSVRFGNVLGSNGSVIPIFKKQIAAGGPVTITHPEMRRFFMTIPEAAQLVLQASTMGNGGDIFVLEMGDPVKIVDLATNLILFSGLQPDKDIKIEFTGVRPGEKLYEEVCTLEEDTLPTFHQKIRIYSGPCPSRLELDEKLSAIRHFCELRDARNLLLEIKDLVPEYNPSSYILRKSLKERPTAHGRRADSKLSRAASV